MSAAPSPSRRDGDERRIIVLGSTGSIGTQTLEVVAHLNRLHERGEWPVRFKVVGLAAGRNADVVAKQAAVFGVRDTAVAGPAAAGADRPGLRTGPDAALRLVEEVECDVVLGAMVGAAGLPATLAAVRLGRDVALANKETLVAAGSLVAPAAGASGARLLPVDSEHCGLWQCLAAQSPSVGGAEQCPPMRCGAGVRRAILTASGGPFRTWTKEQTYNATREQALNHPTWQMGPKVTIDSASLMNKALEVIEAHWLFGLPGGAIDVLVHPQSVVHAMVEFADSTLVAQLAKPDMRTPIQYAITWPRQAAGAGHRLDLTTLSRLEFAPPDMDRFPALALAYRVIEAGGTSGAVLNAANEEAVAAFLSDDASRRIPFGRIAELAREALDAIDASPVRSLEDVTEADERARCFVRSRLGR